MTSSRTLKTFLLTLAICIVNVAVAYADNYEITEGNATYQCITVDKKYQTEKVGDYTIYHTKIVSTTAKNLVIYNDVGSAWNYRTIFIDHDACKNNKKLETVTFEDTSSGSAKVHTILDMSWGDHCFANCPNLKAIYMKYNITTNGDDGENHVVMIPPSWVRPEGTGTFDGSPNVRIYVDAEYYYDYCNDKWWGRYKNLIVPTTSMRYSGHKASGARYDYDRNRDATCTPIKTKPNLDGVSSTKNVLLQHIVGSDDSNLKDHSGNLTIYNDVGDGYVGRTTKVWAKSFYGNTELRHISIQDVNTGSPYSHVNITLGDSAFANCENLHVLDLVYKHKDGSVYSNLNPDQVVLKKEGFEAKGVFANCPNLYIRVYPGYVDKFRNDSVHGWSEYADRIVGYFDEPSGGDTYKGLKYSYIYPTGSKDYYTNKNNEGMKTFLESFSSQITSRSFRADSLLAAPDVHKNQTVRYKFIGGYSSGLADGQNGIMTIVNDFGATYNYRTIAISPTAFRGNQDLKEIQFQDLPDNYACETYYPLRLAIPDEAFKGCKNLKVLNMSYFVTKGTNHYETLGPENVYIGKNVFDDCDEDFTIRVAPERLAEFLDNPDWARYKDHIRAWEYAPTAEDPITEKGVTYDYAATLVNNLPNEKVTRLNYSLLNIPIQAAKIAVTTVAAVAGLNGWEAFLWASEHGASFGWSLVYAIYFGTGETLLKTSLINAAIGMGIGAASTSATVLFDQLGMNGLGKILGSVLNVAGFFNTRQIVEDGIWAGLKEGVTGGWGGKSWYAINNLYTGYSNYAQKCCTKLQSDLELSNTKGLKTTTLEDKELDQIGSTDEYPEVASWLDYFSLFKTTQHYNIYKMYISKVGDLTKEKDGTMKIYNDVGSVYNYRTVAIGENAVKGNNTVKKVVFSDVYGSSAEAYTPLCMFVPDYAFKDCSNLETFNMFIYMSHRLGKDRPLGPNNVVLLGSHVFDNCPKLKIRIAREKYEEFLNDSIWSQYKDRFEIVDWKEESAFSEKGCSYGYNLVNNSLISKDDGVWNIHVIGPSGDNCKDIKIANDPGTVYDYHTTYVQKNAFRGYKPLETIAFWDMTTNTAGSNENPNVEIELRDSCFAGCPNLKSIDLLYYVFDGTDHREALTPSQITLGSGVFANCPKDFKILVDADQYAKFVTDPMWMEYTEHIVPYYYSPSDANVKDILQDGYKAAYSSEFYKPTPLKSNEAISDDAKKKLQYFWEYSLVNNDSNRDFIVPKRQFADFTDLRLVTLPYKTVSIGESAFENTHLSKIRLHKNVKRIGANAFKNNRYLRTVEMHYDKPSEMTVDQTAFDGLPSNYVIYVPDSLVDEYKKYLPYYAPHINSEAEKVARKRSVVVNCKEADDVMKYFKVDMEIEEVIHTNTPIPGQGQTESVYKPIFTSDDDLWLNTDSLKVTGPLSPADLVLIRKMSNKPGSLSYLDLSEAYLYYKSYKYKNEDQTISANGNTFNKLSLLENGSNTFNIADCLSGQYLRTVYWSKDKIQSGCLNNIKFNNIVFPENFEGFTNAYRETPGSARYVFVTKNLPSEMFITDKNTDIVLYVPYSAKITYASAKNYGLKAGAVKSLFLDDDAYKAVCTNGHLFTEEDLAMADYIDAWFKNNKSVKNLDDLHQFTSVKRIVPETFSGCSSLERITVPISVQNIGHDAFKGCTNLMSIRMLTDTVPTLEGEDATLGSHGMFSDLPENFRIYVKDKMLEKFLNNPQWKKYRQHIMSFLQTDELKVVNMSKPGELANKLGINIEVNSGKITGFTGSSLDHIRRMKINGPITDSDLAILHYLTGRAPYSDLEVPTAQLRYLDLSDAYIVKPVGTNYKVANHSGAYVNNDDELPKYAFYDCDKLEKIILPRTLKKIKGYALSKCNNLNTIVLGENVSRVDGRAFEDSPRLVSIAITSKTLPSFASDVFGSNAGVLYNKHNFVENIHSSRALRQTIANNKLLQEHTLHVLSNFDDDAMFRSVAMHCVLDTVSASLIDNIDGWFTGNTELKDARQLRVFDGVKTIGNDLFNGCNALEKVVMPKNITALGSDAFNGCNNLQYVDMTDSRDLAVDEFSRESGVFAGVPARTLVYMPQGNTQQFNDVNVVNTSDIAEQSDDATVATARCADYQLEDRITVDVPRKFRAEKVEQGRVFNPGVKSTVFLPFGMSAEQTAALGKFYEFESFDNEANEVTFTRVESTRANTAYLFIPDGTGFNTTEVNVNVSRESDPNEVCFIGTYHNMKIESNPWAYGYVGTPTEGFELGQFVKVKEGASVPSMRAYLQLKGISAPKLAARFVDNGSVTGIGSITNGEVAADAPTDVYTTDGRKVRSNVMASECLKDLPSGIYVVRGKKYIVK